jgi:RNA polymerase sigma factor (TIGR02999 family)
MRAAGDSESGGDSEITRLLRASRAGDVDALGRILPVLYDELRKLAQSMLGPERTGHTLDATALVHEAWLRLARQHSIGFEHRGQFFAVAAKTMRHVLVDHARRRGRQKRGGGAEAEPLDEALAALESSSGDLLELEIALEELGRVDPRKARLVELRFFAGLDMRASAEVLEISQRQAEREWTTARSFLRSKLDAIRASGS